jgi:hypothetical protein
MKRLLSIFFMLFLLLAAMHPTVVFHYCGGNLRSIGLSDNQEQSSCCCGKCCSDYKVTLATDDYQTTPTVTVGTDLQTLHLAPFLLTGDLFLQHPDCISNLIQPIPPPGGLPKYGVDLLNFICVFRI